MIRYKGSFNRCGGCVERYKDDHLIPMQKQPDSMEVVICSHCIKEKTNRLDNEDYEIRVIRQGGIKWESASMCDIKHMLVSNVDELDSSDDEYDIKKLKIHDTKTGKICVKIDTKTQFFEDSHKWFPYVPKKSFLEKQIEDHKKIVEDLEKWYEDLYKEKYINKKRKIQCNNDTVRKKK